MIFSSPPRLRRWRWRQLEGKNCWPIDVAIAAVVVVAAAVEIGSSGPPPFLMFADASIDLDLQRG